ncbi:MAG TPA: LysR family transcriptional regulator [Devosiaceae bacterium]
MDQLKQIRLFMEVARSRSFSAAARRLGISRASMTKHVAMLEQSMDVVLLNRTTQHVALTEPGRLLLEEGAHLLDEYEQLQSRLRHAENEPSGTIRVGTPPAFGEMHLMPAVTAFTQTYPKMRVDLHLDDGHADLVRDGLDVSLRIGAALKDSSLIARLLMRVPQVLVASPAYVQSHGAPISLAELPRHNCLIHRTNSPGDTWHFGNGEERASVAVTGSISSNFGEVLRAAAILGTGISQHALYMVDRDIRAGRLVVLLPEIKPVELTISAIYPRRNPPARIAKFIEFLRNWLPKQASWLETVPQMPDGSATRANPLGQVHPAAPLGATASSPVSVRVRKRGG